MILPGAALFELAVAAGQLLWTSERESDACGLQDAAISVPVVLSLPSLPSPSGSIAAAATPVLTCTIDNHAGAVVLEALLASAGARQSRNMAAALYRMPKPTLSAAAGSNGGSNGSSHASASDTKRSRVWLPAPGSRGKAMQVTADLCSDCQHDSGYRLHPALADAAIHAGAAARSADDTSFLVSVSTDCYAAPASLVVGFVGVQLSDLAADGSVLSSHRLAASGAGAAVAGTILGVLAKPPRRSRVARPPPAAGAAIAAPATSWAAAHASQHAAWVPVFDETYAPLPPEPRLLPDTMPTLGPGFGERVGSAALRDDLPPGFDAAVDRFERWCTQLLLDGFQRLGFFTSAGDAETKDSIMRKVPAMGVQDKMSSGRLATLWTLLLPGCEISAAAEHLRPGNRCLGRP